MFLHPPNQPNAHQGPVGVHRLPDLTHVRHGFPGCALLPRAGVGHGASTYRRRDAVCSIGLIRAIDQKSAIRDQNLKLLTPDLWTLTSGVSAKALWSERSNRMEPK